MSIPKVETGLDDAQWEEAFAGIQRKLEDIFPDQVLGATFMFVNKDGTVDVTVLGCTGTLAVMLEALTVEAEEILRERGII